MDNMHRSRGSSPSYRLMSVRPDGERVAFLVWKVDGCIWADVENHLWYVLYGNRRKNFVIHRFFVKYRYRNRMRMLYVSDCVIVLLD